MIKLSSCPFCGGPCHHEQGKPAESRDITFIFCDCCGAVVSFRPRLSGKQAIEAFNARASIFSTGRVQ